MMIQSIMLVALGFLVGALLALLLLPFLWRRAVRLTTERITSRMPVSLGDIRADKDQLRAEFAIKIRHFEVELEKANMQVAKQRIEISRRDVHIETLESRIAALSTDLEEQQNAKKVLEQTVADRLPKLEAQLNKAKDVLGTRFQEITKLQTTIDRQEDKLDEARSVDNVRQSEMERLKYALDQSYEDVQRTELTANQQAEFEALSTKNKVLANEIAELTQALAEAREREEKETVFLKSEMHKLADQILTRVNGAAQVENKSATTSDEVEDESSDDEETIPKIVSAGDREKPTATDNSDDQEQEKSEGGEDDAAEKESGADTDETVSLLNEPKKGLRLRERLKGLQIRNSR